MAPTTNGRRTTSGTRIAAVPKQTPPPAAPGTPADAYLVHLDPRDLLAHPSNPRRDYGDLTSLRQTIVEQGVLQALTVIPEPTAASGSPPVTAAPPQPPKRSRRANGRRPGRRPCRAWCAPTWWDCPPTWWR